MSDEEEATMPTATKLAGLSESTTFTEQNTAAKQESPLVASLRAHFKKWYVRDKVLGEMEIIDSSEEAA